MLNVRKGLIERVIEIYEESKVEMIVNGKRKIENVLANE